MSGIAFRLFQTLINTISSIPTVTVYDIIISALSGLPDSDFFRDIPESFPVGFADNVFKTYPGEFFHEFWLKVFEDE